MLIHQAMDISQAFSLLLIIFLQTMNNGFGYTSRPVYTSMFLKFFLSFSLSFLGQNNEDWSSRNIYHFCLISCSEQILIPSDKPFIYIQGEGKWKTRVIWGGSGPIITCATLISQADNIVIKSVSFTVSSTLYYIYYLGKWFKEMVTGLLAT